MKKWQPIVAPGWMSIPVLLCACYEDRDWSPTRELVVPGDGQWSPWVADLRREGDHYAALRPDKAAAVIKAVQDHLVGLFGPR